MKQIFITLLLLLATTLSAQVSVISVTDEDKYTKKEDFWHTYEYFVLPSAGGSYKCQATRIGRKWFVTAAHCVYKVCEKGCQIRMDMLEQPVSAFGNVTHIPSGQGKNPLVFIHPEYDPNIITKNDIAIIKFDFDRAFFQFYERPKTKAGVNMQITKAQFNQYLQKYPKAMREYNSVISPDRIPLVAFDEADYQLDREMSVISIFDGVRSIKKDPYAVYYVKKLGFAYTKDFGLRKGMSGSGVMINTGELIGIISSYVSLSTFLGNEKVKDQSFFMFTAFNKSILDFLESVMGSDYYKLDILDANPGYVKKTRKNHQAVLFAVEDTNRKAGGVVK